MENSVKYQTVEGHEIVRDGVYETREGNKATILGFIPDSFYEDRAILGFTGEPTNGKNYPEGWKANGMSCLSHSASSLDLMRLWVDTKEDHISDEGKMVDEGWVEWKGGDRPVPARCSVEVKFRDDSLEIDWPKNLRWHYLDKSDDIVAYRIVKPTPKESSDIQYPRYKKLIDEDVTRRAAIAGSAIVEEPKKLPPLLRVKFQGYDVNGKKEGKKVVTFINYPYPKTSEEVDDLENSILDEYCFDHVLVTNFRRME